MRRLAVIPLALLFGCWDFDSLTGGMAPVVDASDPGDIACGKTPKQIKEDCTSNRDDNNNCLVGCEDPDCFDHVACFASKGYKGYGNVVDTGSQCNTAPQTPIFQTLAAPPANCNGSCAANSTTSCSTTLHVYPNMADCTAKANTDTKVTLTTGTACSATATSLKDSAYLVDALVAGGACTPKMNSLFLPAVWGTSKVLCDQSASGITTFAGMKSNGIACVVFNGTNAAVCESTKIYTKANVYYQGTVANNSITCTCAAASTGTCSLTDGGGAALLNLTDKTACGANAMLTAVKTAASCVQPKDGMMNTYQTVAASYAVVAPSCNVTGAVTGAYAPRDGLTVCCM